MKWSMILLSASHIILGFICLAVGTAWIILSFEHESFIDDRLPSFAFIVTLPEIICGFLIFISGCIGICVKHKTSNLGLTYIICNVFNLLVWTPVLVVGYALLLLTIQGDAKCGSMNCLPSDWNTYHLEYLLPSGQDWGYIFPGSGLTIGLVDFAISFGVIATYCCNSKRRKEGLTS
ncbi:uncharacterized protein [Watersipora subatra]|uniref:uncharacterized protein isoform X1 n=1 Tax=Watersipora subatra TaxID=2589382 RepID=UPI00355B5076